jgi:hypothetical protein
VTALGCCCFFFVTPRPLATLVSTALLRAHPRRGAPESAAVVVPLQARNGPGPSDIRPAVSSSHTQLKAHSRMHRQPAASHRTVECASWPRGSVQQPQLPCMPTPTHVIDYHITY